MCAAHLVSQEFPQCCRLDLSINYDPSQAVSGLDSCLLIIMYIYHALINALGAHMIHINLNMIFYTHVEYSPTKTIYTKYYTKIITK